MNATDRIVFVVDGDHRIREALYELVTSMGMSAVTFACAADYFEFAKPDLPACLVLEVQLPDINGLDLQEQIADQAHPPIVFITGHGDVRSSVRAIKAGAIDFLTKPFRQSDLMEAIHAGIARDRKVRSERAAVSELQQRLI